MFDLEAYLTEKKLMVERELHSLMPTDSTRPSIIHEAMRYSVFAGGKRLRPILAMAAAEAVGAPPEYALVPGLAVEVLHTYTLIHDDLPCMDDDDLRRGKPTSHKVFGEANAVLAGDALLTLAFEWLAATIAPAPYSPNQLAMELAIAAGSRGVIGGQVEDMAATGKTPSADAVDFIHAHKTAALLRAAVRMGGISGSASESELNQLGIYGQSSGLAFQIVDDILDATASAEQLGKDAGSDAAQGKMTYVAVHGLDSAAAKARELVDEAIGALAGLNGNTKPLAALAAYIVERTS